MIGSQIYDFTDNEPEGDFIEHKIVSVGMLFFKHQVFKESYPELVVVIYGEENLTIDTVIAIVNFTQLLIFEFLHHFHYNLLFGLCL